MKPFLELSKAVESAKKELLDEQKKLTTRTAKFEELKQKLIKFPLEGDLVELNVGGRHFTTYQSTLCKYENSMLEAMFSGRHPLKKDKDGSKRGSERELKILHREALH